MMTGRSQQMLTFKKRWITYTTAKVNYVCSRNSDIKEEVTGGGLLKVPGQPKWHSKTLSQKTQPQQRKEKTVKTIKTNLWYILAHLHIIFHVTVYLDEYTPSSTHSEALLPLSNKANRIWAKYLIYHETKEDLNKQKVCEKKFSHH